MARAEAALVDVPVEARSGLEEYVFQLIYAAAEKRRRELFSRRPEADPGTNGDMSGTDGKTRRASSGKRAGSDASSADGTQNADAVPADASSADAQETAEAQHVGDSSEEPAADAQTQRS